MEGHVNFAIHGEDHFVSDSVDIDGVPLSVSAFGGGAMIGVAGIGIQFSSGVPGGMFFFVGCDVDVGSGGGEGDEVADVFFLDLASEGALPDIPKSAVFSDAVEEDAGVAPALEAGFPFFVAPLELHREMVVFELGLGGESGVDFSGDLEDVVAVFLNDGEDTKGVVVEAKGGAFDAVFTG